MRQAPAFRLAAALTATLLAPALPAAAEVMLSAHLGPAEVRPGDYVTLTVEARGEIYNRVGFAADFELINLERVGEPVVYQGISRDSDGTSRSYRKTWRLRAQSYGTAAVRNLRVSIAGRRMSLATETVKVVSEPSGPSDPLNQGRPGARPSRPPGLLDSLLGRDRSSERRPKIRLVAETVPARPWAGQQVTYNLWLETQTRVYEQSFEALPDFQGFWVEKPVLKPEATVTRVEREGETYLRRLVARYAVFPIRPGRYELEPSKLLVLAWMSRFDSRHVVLTSNPVRVDVRPLPPVPADLEGRWSGLVGDYELEARLLPSEVTVGDAATLELALSGRGHAGGLELPMPEIPAGLEAMPAERTAASRMTGGEVTGQRTWRVPLVPERTGTWRVPAVEIAFFHPDGEYRLATTEAQILRARRDTGGGPAGRGSELLHPLKNAALPLDDAATAPWRRALPRLFAIPWALILAVGLVRALRDPRPGADAGAYERFADRVAGVAGEDRPRRAALTLEEAWRDLLAEAYGVAPEVPAADWPRHLEEVGVARSRADDLGELVDDIHYLRHAPQLSTVSELAGDLRDRSLRLAHRLAP